jgi:hypothetical protein
MTTIKSSISDIQRGEMSEELKRLIAEAEEAKTEAETAARKAAKAEAAWAAAWVKYKAKVVAEAAKQQEQVK